MCLKVKGIKIYTFDGMTPQETRTYIARHVDDTDLETEVLAYLDKTSGQWFQDSAIVPAKINALVDLIEEGIEPEDEDDFYDKYMDFIFEREENEKKETRIEELRYLLYILASNLSHPMDEMNKNKIITLWTTEGSIDSEEAHRLFKLAAEFPVLVPGVAPYSYRFAYPQYMIKMRQEGI